MTYPSELFALGQPLLMQFDQLRCSAKGDRDVSERRSACPLRDRRSAMRSHIRVILLGDPDIVDQNVIELERRGYCDSYAWTPPLLIRESAPPIQPLPGELMRLYQRWSPPTDLRLPL